MYTRKKTYVALSGENRCQQDDFQIDQFHLNVSSTTLRETMIW